MNGPSVGYIIVGIAPPSRVVRFGAADFEVSSRNYAGARRLRAIGAQRLAPRPLRTSASVLLAREKGKVTVSPSPEPTASASVRRAVQVSRIVLSTAIAPLCQPGWHRSASPLPLQGADCPNARCVAVNALARRDDDAWLRPSIRTASRRRTRGTRRSHSASRYGGKCSIVRRSVPPAAHRAGRGGPLAHGA